MCMANRIAAIAPTPAASPSSPSSQFTVFIIPRIQKHVNIMISTGPNNGQTCSSTMVPERGFVKRSINIVVLIAIADAPSCANS